jgi:hypothetical protein
VITVCTKFNQNKKTLYFHIVILSQWENYLNLEEIEPKEKNLGRLVQKSLVHFDLTLFCQEHGNAKL